MQTQIIPEKTYKVPEHFGLFYIASVLAEYPSQERFASTFETLEELKLHESAASIDLAS